MCVYVCARVRAFVFGGCDFLVRREWSLIQIRRPHRKAQVIWAASIPPQQREDKTTRHFSADVEILIGQLRCQ